MLLLCAQPTVFFIMVLMGYEPVTLGLSGFVVKPFTTFRLYANGLNLNLFMNLTDSNYLGP